MSDSLVSQELDKMLHHLFALLYTLTVLFNQSELSMSQPIRTKLTFDGYFLCSGLKTKEILNVQLCRLFKAGPFWVLWMDAVHTVLIDLHSTSNTLIPGLNVQGSCSQILGVSLSAK